MTREDIQNNVAANKDKKLIILEHATGLGKSFSALRVVEDYENTKILLIVAEIAHKNNWIEEINKFSSIYGTNIADKNDITIECYASLKKYNDTEWDIIILDEVHHLSDLRSEILSTIKTDRLVALSATMDSDTKYFLIDYMKVRDSDIYDSKITLQKSIKLGLLQEPRVYLIPLTLDFINPSEEIIIKRGSSKNYKNINTTYENLWYYMKNKKEYPDLHMTVKCTPKEKYDYLTSNMEYWKNYYMRNGREFARNKWLNTGTERKRVLGETKTKFVSSLLSRIEHLRYICFCASIEQANSLGGDKAIHSKSFNSILTLDKFQNKEINSIFVVGMLTEGQNLKDIEAGVIVQLDGKQRLYVQKAGRVFRSEDPIQFVFFYKDTQDEAYLENMLKNVDSSFIQTIDNIYDINV